MPENQDTRTPSASKSAPGPHTIDSEAVRSVAFALEPVAFDLQDFVKDLQALTENREANAESPTLAHIAGEMAPLTENIVGMWRDLWFAAIGTPADSESKAVKRRAPFSDYLTSMFDALEAAAEPIRRYERMKEENPDHDPGGIVGKYAAEQAETAILEALGEVSVEDAYVIRAMVEARIEVRSCPEPESVAMCQVVYGCEEIIQKAPRRTDADTAARLSLLEYLLREFEYEGAGEKLLHAARLDVWGINSHTNPKWEARRKARTHARA